MGHLEDFWNRVDSILDRKGTRLIDMARDTGIGYPTIKNWRYLNSIPKVDVVIQMSEYLEVSLDYLLTGKEAEALSKEAMAVEFDDKLKAVIRALQRDPHLLEIISAVVISSELHPVGL